MSYAATKTFFQRAQLVRQRFKQFISRQITDCHDEFYLPTLIYIYYEYWDNGC